MAEDPLMEEARRLVLAVLEGDSGVRFPEHGFAFGQIRRREQIEKLAPEIAHALKAAEERGRKAGLITGAEIIDQITIPWTAPNVWHALASAARRLRAMAEEER